MSLIVRRLRNCSINIQSHWGSIRTNFCNAVMRARQIANDGMTNGAGTTVTELVKLSLVEYIINAGTKQWAKRKFRVFSTAKRTKTKWRQPQIAGEKTWKSRKPALWLFKAAFLGKLCSSCLDWQKSCSRYQVPSANANEKASPSPAVSSISLRLQRDSISGQTGAENKLKFRAIYGNADSLIFINRQLHIVHATP